MKRSWLITIFFIGVLAASISAQTVCPEGSQCVKNETINKCADVADRLRDALKTIEAFTVERGASQIAIDARDALLKAKDAVIALDGQTDAAKDRYIAALVAINKLQADVNEQQAKQLAKKGSGFSKFLKAAQIIYYGLSIALLL